MCLDYDLQGKDMTSEQILNYITENLEDNKTRKGLNNILESLKDKKLGEITTKELAKIAEEIGDDLNEEYLTTIIKTISELSANINIKQNEFFYIMTKKPEYALKITMATKKALSN